MIFFKRLKYFSFGLIIGIFLIFFFFGNRISYCSYFPNSRVLNNIRKKEIIFNNKEILLKNYNINNLELYNNKHFVFYKLLIYGKVNFTKSIIRNTKYPIYIINYKNKYNKDEVIFSIQNQEKIALVKNIKIIKNKF